MNFLSIATVAMTSFLPMPLNSVESIPVEPVPLMGIYGDYKEQQHDDEFFSFFGNKEYIMEKNSTGTFTESGNSNFRLTNQTMVTKLLNLIDENSIELGEYYEFFDFLNTIRKEEKYYNFLNYVSQIDSIKLNLAVLSFLAQKNYKFIIGSEEDFAVKMLRHRDVQIQEFALNAILVWDQISDLEGIKSIRLSNRFLQEDLQEFIEEHS